MDTAKAYINGRLAMSLAELGEAAGATAAGERANPMSTASAVHGNSLQQLFEDPSVKPPRAPVRDDICICIFF